MKIPTIERFNAWSLADKQFWLDYETDRIYSEANVPGFIFYDNLDMAIKYRVDKKSKLIEAEAMSLNDAHKAFKKFIPAVRSMGNNN